MQKLSYILLFWTALLTACLIGQDLQAQPQAPDSEKRSSIHEVDGFAYLSEDKTLSQIRSEAFALAKRQALEAAQTYIKSKTEVEDFVLSYDLVWSKAEGSVRVLEQKDYGVEENSRYHVWIKAEVFYNITPKMNSAASQASASGKAQPASSPALDSSSGPLTVKVWTDKKTYSSGENVVVFMKGNRDFSAVVVDVMSSGEIIQLLPNEHRAENFFKAGETYEIPGPRDQFTLTVTPPFGTDKIVVYASEQYLDSLPTKAIGGGLGQFAGTQKEVAVRTRGLRIQPKKSQKEKKPEQGVEFYEAQWSFSTAGK